jgi:tRNA(fMet)-specific endonuclease VapC
VRARRVLSQDDEGEARAADTDILTLYSHGDAVVVQRVDAQSPAELAISVITVDEQLTGWYTLARRARAPGEIARAYRNLGDAVVRLA